MLRRRGVTDIRNDGINRVITLYKGDEATCKQVVTCSCYTLQLPSSADQQSVSAQLPQLLWSKRCVFYSYPVGK